jgi:protein-tyrosine phosphatase
MRPDIYTVMQMGDGFLAVMAKPVAGEWIEEQFLGVAQYGIKCMVSLLEPHEIRDVGLAKAPDLCQSNGINYINHPIRDRGVPPASAQTFGLIADIHQRIMLGENTVIHCWAGIGRTGLLAASVLVQHGFGPAEAFQTVSAARGVQTPDTEEQTAWVAAHQRVLQAK